MQKYSLKECFSPHTHRAAVSALYTTKYNIQKRRATIFPFEVQFLEKEVLMVKLQRETALPPTWL